jgi:hypothetical protein
MGLEYHGVRFLVHCKNAGVSYERLLTLGRQNLTVSQKGLQARPELGFSPNIIPSLFCEDGYSDSLLAHLGSRDLQMIDFSAFEGATIIHDMNTPVTRELHNRFSCVLDSGTLEHVFNFPIALENSLRMVEVGGHFLAITPCNNFPGHGFYQFSPDVFTTTLGPQNGFQLEDIMVMETVNETEWYQIEPPKDANQRMLFRSCYPAYLMVRAKKISEVPEGQLRIQQPFYENLWKNPPTYDEFKNERSWFRKTGSTVRKTAARLLFGNPFAHSYFKKTQK